MDRFTGDAADFGSSDTDSMTAGMWRYTDAELLNAIADDAETMLRSEVSSLCKMAELVARDSASGCSTSLANHLCSNSTLTLAKARGAVRLATRLHARPSIFVAVRDAEITKAAAIMIMDFFDTPPENMTADELARTQDVLLDCARTQGRTRLSSIIAGIRDHYREPPRRGDDTGAPGSGKGDDGAAPPDSGGADAGSGTPGADYGRCRPESRGADDSVRNSLFVSRTLGGRYAVRGDLDSETGERLVTALSPFSAPRPEHDGTRDRRPAARRRADGLAEFLRRHTRCGSPADGDTGSAGGPGHGGNASSDGGAQAACSTPPSDGASPMGTTPDSRDDDERPAQPATQDLGGTAGTGTALSLHIGLRDLADTDDDIAVRSALISQGRFEEVFDNLPHGMSDWFANVPVGAARRLACDAAVTPIGVDSDGVPLNLGRTRRLAGRSQRRALAARDHGCAFPRCDRPPAWCIAHHIWHWVDGGPTDLDNLVSLCSEHHRAVHHRGWTVAVDARNRLPRFLAPAGDSASSQWLDSDGAPVDTPRPKEKRQPHRDGAPAV